MGDVVSVEAYETPDQSNRWKALRFLTPDEEPQRPRPGPGPVAGGYGGREVFGGQEGDQGGRVGRVRAEAGSLRVEVRNSGGDLRSTQPAERLVADVGGAVGRGGGGRGGGERGGNGKRGPGGVGGSGGVGGGWEEGGSSPLGEEGGRRRVLCSGAKGR